MSKRYRLSFFFPLLMIGATVAVILRTVASIFDFDFIYGYYYGSPTFIGSVWVTVIVSVLLFSFALLPTRHNEPELPFGTPILYIPSALSGVALAFTAFSAIAKAISLSADLTNSFLVPLDTVALVSGALALASTVYFALCCLICRGKSDLRAVFGMVTVIFLVFYAVYLYFDTRLAINAHAKSIDQLAYIFLAAFFLFETRISLGRQSWKLYVGFGFVSALLSAYSSIPTLITYFVKGKLMSDSLSGAVLTLALLVYVVARLIQSAILNDNERCPTVTAIIEESKARAEAISVHENELMQTIEDSEAARLEDKRIADVAELHELISENEEEQEKSDVLIPEGSAEEETSQPTAEEITEDREEI